jgi:hypothetical protein
MSIDKLQLFDPNIEAEFMTIVLKSEAEEIAKHFSTVVKSMAAAGMGKEQILAKMTEDFFGNGPLFGAMNQSARANIGKIIDNFAQGGIISKYPQEKLWTWIATSGNPCPDCIERHGITKTYQEWQEDGVPRSGVTVCTSNCLCILVPSDSVPNNFGEPVQVQATTKARKDFIEKYKTDPETKSKVLETKAHYRFRKDPESWAKYQTDPDFRGKINAEIEKRSLAMQKAYHEKMMIQADSIAKVEKEMNRFYPATKYNLQGCDLDGIKEVLKEFDRIGVERPDVFAGLEHFTTENYSYWLRNPGAYGTARIDGTRISINPTYYGNIQFFKECRLKDVLSGFHPLGAENFQGNLVHELGHFLDFKYNISNSAVFNEYLDECMNNGTAWILENLSRYALTSKYEFLAEAWTEYVLNKSPREIATKIGRIVAEKADLTEFL